MGVTPLLRIDLMKICFFTDTFYPIVGGAETVLHNLALNLLHKGHIIYVLAPNVKKSCEPDAFPYAVMRYESPSSKRFLVRQTLVHLIWIYIRYGFDILHCHAAYPQAYVGATFKNWFKTPLVVRPHGSDIVPSGRMRNSKRIEKRLIKGLLNSDALIAQGQYIKEILIDLGISEQKIQIIHNGVNLDRFGRGNVYAHPRPYILAMGSLIYRKGFDLLIRAFREFKNQNIDLLIAGQGREESSLRNLCKTSGLDHCVHFLGIVKGQNKVNLFRTAKFLVCPSRNEPFSNVIIEALSSGIPVLASDIGGNRELIQHGQNGLLFASENVQDLSKNLHRMFENTGMLEKMRFYARKSTTAFDWPYVAERYIALYEEVLRNNQTQLINKKESFPK